MPRVRVIMCLGAFAWDAAARLLGVKPKPRFAHLAEHETGAGIVMLGCFHPSQQNTFTGRLTAQMMDAALTRARELALLRSR